MAGDKVIVIPLSSDICGHRCFNTTVANRCVKQRFRGDLHDTKSVNNGFRKRRFFPAIFGSQ